MATMAAVLNSRTRLPAITRITRIAGVEMNGQTLNKANRTVNQSANTKAMRPARSRPCILSILSSSVIKPACWLTVASISPPWARPDGCCINGKLFASEEYLVKLILCQADVVLQRNTTFCRTAQSRDRAPAARLRPYVAPLCPAGHLPRKGGDQP